MGAFTDLWKSERGLLAILIIIAASVFVGIDKMTVGDWQTFVMVIFGTYAAGKTITSAASIIKGVTDTVPPVASPVVAPVAPPAPPAAPPEPATP